MDLDHLAIRQLADFDRREPGAMFADPGFHLSIAEAYELQQAVAQLREQRGERVAGYKAGCVSRAMREQLGLDRPVFGYVWQSELHASGTALDPRAFCGLAIEGELAVRLAVDVPSPEWLVHHAVEALAAAFVVIELHHYVFRGGPGKAAAELIANNAIHAGVVMPLEEPPLSDPETLLHAPLSVLRNGELLGTASGSSLEEGPLGSVLRLAEHLARRGQRLRRGQIVLTGSPLPLWRVETGDRIEARCDRLGGSVGLTFGSTIGGRAGGSGN